MPHGVPHTSYRSYARTVGTDCSLGLRSGIRCNSAPRPCTLARGLTRQGLDRTRRQKAAPLPPDGSASGPDVLTRSSFRRTLGPEPRRQGSKSNPAHDSGRVRSNQGGLCRQKYSHKHTASSIQNNPQKLRDPVPNQWVSVSTPYPCVAGRGEKLDPHTNYFFGRLPFRETDPPEQVGLRQGEAPRDQRQQLRALQVLSLLLSLWLLSHLASGPPWQQLWPSVVDSVLAEVRKRRTPQRRSYTPRSQALAAGAFWPRAQGFKPDDSKYL